MTDPTAPAAVRPAAPVGAPAPCLTNGKFAAALPRLWPHGNSKVPGLIEGTIGAAPIVFPRWGLSSDLVIAHAMAQFSEECGAGTEMQENMNYSAARLLQVFPTHFNHEQAIALAHQPRRIADQAYNGRMGNRVGTDDGWDRRGQGFSQLTGLDAYRQLADKTGIDVFNHPELLCDPAHALECGVADFVMCGCLPYAQRDHVLYVSALLNVGHIVTDPSRVNGYSMRVHWLSLWKHVLGVAQ